jgi:hypothetical protein
MIVHLIAAHNERYLRYALICIHSLITNGHVRPEKIILTTDVSWEDHPAIALLRGYGVCIHLQAYIGGKFLELDRILDCATGYGIAVQLDVDTIVNGDFDFLRFCSEAIEEFNIAYYPQARSAKIVQATRMIPQLVNSRFVWTDPGNAFRLSAMMQALFGFSLRNYIDWLETEAKWMFGGVILVNEKFVCDDPVWEKMVAMNTIIHCDETVMMITKAAYPKLFKSIPEMPIPHTVNPPSLMARYDHQQNEIIHYAGDWYREQNEHNKKFLDTLYQSLVN